MKIEFVQLFIIIKKSIVKEFKQKYASNATEKFTIGHGQSFNISVEWIKYFHYRVQIIARTEGLHAI